MNSNRPPWLVVDDLRRVPDHPTQVGVDLHLGGHPLHAIFDFRRPEFFEYVTIPWLLSALHTSLRVVARLAAGFHSGEQIALPVDLSELAAEDAVKVFDGDPEKIARLCEEADRVNLEIEELSQSGSYPASFSGRLRVDGIQITLRCELYTGTGKMTAWRWLHGSNPEALSRAQKYAIELMLVERLMIDGT